MNSLESVKSAFSAHVKDLQERITAQIKQVDPNVVLTEDLWQRQDFAGNPGGGGRTRAFAGEVFENAGVNFSEVSGKIDPKFAAQVGGDSDELWAAGISLILHPRNPRVPTTHMNFRMIVAGSKWWFGGGADLTPFYPHEEDFQYFHKTWKDACTPYGQWESMKKKCDEYFVNSHRGGEMRGIGGVFFDHFNTGDLDTDFNMAKNLSEFFIPSYFPLVESRKNEEFNAADEEFMLHRRGRYVEFNLLHDRGTLFGLKTNGRIDSILISLPGRCKFTYKYAPDQGSVHEKMLDYYYPKDWA